jgi:hypothetical protein
MNRCPHTGRPQTRVPVAGARAQRQISRTLLMRTAIRLSVILAAVTITGAPITASRTQSPAPAAPESRATSPAAPESRATSPAARKSRATSDDQNAAAFRQFKALPLRFEPNVGQANGEVRFLARLGADSLYLTSDAAVFAAAPSGAKSAAGSRLTLSWLGANRQAPIAGVDELQARSNY